MKEFNIEEQYQLYLKRMALSEKTMHPQQKTQLRQTFFGAAGQLLIWLRDEVSALEEPEAIKAFEDLIKQVRVFFLSETHRNN